MNVRSITVFAPFLTTPTAAELAPLAALAVAAREALTSEGFMVQTTRLALAEWLPLLPNPESPEADAAVALATELAQQTSNAGFDYVALGPVRATAPHADLTPLRFLPAMLAATENLFATVEIANMTQGINTAAALAAAETIQANATIDPHGFGNLRFAVLANVAPGSPFFPAAHANPEWTRPALALALESADLAVDAYTGAPNLSSASAALTRALELVGQKLVAAVAPIAAAHQADFLGLDFSLAPFPTPAASGAGAIEALGAQPFGAAGTLLAAALTTQALQTADYPRCGFSGLMLPVLEDSTLAARASEGSYDLHSLLLMSAVCGTGLDTIPLPGDTPRDALAGLLLDTAALALRLNKPLTARLMPIPGKQALEQTTFNFPYFANSAILALRGPQPGALLAGESIRIMPTQAALRQP